MLLNELNLIYIKPKLDLRTDLVCGINIKDLKYKLKKIVKIIKSYDKFIIIDEVNGSHFKYSTLFPKSVKNFKVDVVLQSAHKNGLALTQGAYLHTFNKSIKKS